MFIFYNFFIQLSLNFLLIGEANEVESDQVSKLGKFRDPSVVSSSGEFSFRLPFIIGN